MKIRYPWIASLGGLMASITIRSWMSTLDYRVAHYDPTVDPAHPDFSGRKIYVFWHENILAPIHMRGHCNLAMLVSRHGDAEILSAAAYHLGFECVRGSTNRGGAAALRELVDRGRSMNLTITPDGPRGPRRVMAPGPIYLASRLGMPLVAMGVGYDRPWRLGSWDRFAIPRPYSRARGLISPPLHLPADLDRTALEHYRLQTERLLNRLTTAAEAWAESGARMEHEQPTRREHAKRALWRVDKAALERVPAPAWSRHAAADTSSARVSEDLS